MSNSYNIYKYNDQYCTVVQFNDSPTDRELECIEDISVKNGLPKETLFLSTDEFLGIDYLKDCVLVKKGYKLKRITGDYVYAKTDIIDKQLKLENKKAITITQIKKFYQKWYWYLG